MKESEERKALMGQMQFLGQMSSTETALFQQAAAAKYGLGITEMKTISALLQEGPMTAGQLTRRLNLTTGAVTNLIDRLEKRGWVGRSPDPSDRRKVIVSVNQTQLASGENVYQSMGVAFEALLNSYSTEELRFLVKFHQSVIELTQVEMKKLNQP
ncbi:MAG: MarR family transcriptional regulator [Candidatus Sericytochromatia bacterium]|nr:MarR family transcriptional regulator [Candidatus Sericytochromatia bacterium]